MMKKHLRRQTYTKVNIYYRRSFLINMRKISVWNTILKEDAAYLQIYFHTMRNILTGFCVPITVSASSVPNLMAVLINFLLHFTSVSRKSCAIGQHYMFLIRLQIFRTDENNFRMSLKCDRFSHVVVPKEQNFLIHSGFSALTLPVRRLFFLTKCRITLPSPSICLVCPLKGFSEH